MLSVSNGSKAQTLVKTQRHNAHANGQKGEEKNKTKKVSHSKPKETLTFKVLGTRKHENSG